MVGPLPSGFIKEHDWRVVNEFQGNGQSFLLTSRQVTGHSLGVLGQTKSLQNLLDLKKKLKQHHVDYTEFMSKYIENHRYCLL